MKQDRIHKFVGDQLSRWQLACDNFRALKNVSVRELNAGGLTVQLQFNPARMISSAAKLNKEGLLRLASRSYLVTVVKEKLKGAGCKRDISKTRDMYLYGV